jgi:protein required for attachment to host cells
MILVITANTNDCRIYHYEKKPVQLTLVKEMSQPENKLKSSEMTSDREGHYKSNQSSRGAFSPHMDPKQVEIDKFSRDIANELNHRRNAHDYEKLIIIALPHMYGLMVHHLDKHVKDMLTNHIQKEVMNLSERELLEFLHTNTQYRE